MGQVYLTNMGELLTHAVHLGYGWNQAHNILDKDGVFPEAECHECTYDIDEVCNGGWDWSDDSVKIVKTFMEVNEVTEFTLVRG